MNVALGAYAAAYLAGGWDAALDTFGKLRRFRLDIHFLMLAVAIGAASIGAWWEGGTLLFLFSLSNALEAHGLRTHRTRNPKPLPRRPETRARGPRRRHRARGPGRRSWRPATSIRVRPGDQFPTDAERVSGETAADESALTGESDPVDKRPGSDVFGGTLKPGGRSMPKCCARRPKAPTPESSA